MKISHREVLQIIGQYYICKGNYNFVITDINGEYIHGAKTVRQCLNFIKKLSA